MTRDEIDLWLTRVIPKFERLTTVVASLLESILKNNGIDHLSINGRTKSIQSARKKIDEKGYADPTTKLTDLSGIRIVNYFNRDVHRVSEIIRSTFEVDEANSLDKSADLGRDRVGYRSVHFVCSLGASRRNLPEYEDIFDLKFEIQVRTVLQHAWAEITHDRSYKFGQTLPSEIQRKLNLHAGMLEVVDSGFQEILFSIEEYTRQIAAEADAFRSATINSISLQKFVDATRDRLQINLEKDFGSFSLNSDEIVREVAEFGLTSVGELLDLVTPEFAELHKKHMRYETDIGLIRSILMFSDLEKYIDKTNFSWRAISPNSFGFLKEKFGREKVRELLDSKNIEVHDEFAGFEPPRRRKAK